MDNELKSNKRSNSKKNNGKVNSKNRTSAKWVLTIVLWTIIISGSITLLSNLLLRKVDILVAFIILIIIIIIGIGFDIVGVAVTAANEMPFHAKAAKKISGAKIAVKLIRNADKVSNFCNDVVGDVCGIVSGTVGALIVAKVSEAFPNSNIMIIGALTGAIIASITVGGKAFGKSIAITRSNEIIEKVSRLLNLVKKDR